MTNNTKVEGPASGGDHQDFLEQLIEERAERAPHFRAAVGAASKRRELLREFASLRDRAKISQTELAARMGTSQSAIARLETGEGDPRMSTVERAAAALGINLTWDLEDASLTRISQEKRLHFDEPSEHIEQSGETDKTGLMEALEESVMRVAAASQAKQSAAETKEAGALESLSGPGTSATLLFTRLVCLDIALGTTDLDSPVIGAMATQIAKSYSADHVESLEALLEYLETSSS